eukprot:4611890-Pleurochrysis_carterae.AAC.1
MGATRKALRPRSLLEWTCGWRRRGCGYGRVFCARRGMRTEAEDASRLRFVWVKTQVRVGKGRHMRASARADSCLRVRVWRARLARASGARVWRA